MRKTGGPNGPQAAHAPWRGPRQTETTDGPSSPSALLGGSYLTITRQFAAYCALYLMYRDESETQLERGPVAQLRYGLSAQFPLHHGVEY